MAEKAVRQAKRKFERKLSKAANGTNNKQFNSYVRSKTKGRTIVGPLKDGAGNKVTEHDKVAELLKDFFSSVFSIDGDEPTPTLQKIRSHKTSLGSPP